MVWIAAPLLLFLASCSRPAPEQHAAPTSGDALGTRATSPPASERSMPSLSAEELLALLPERLPEVDRTLPPSTGRKVLSDGSEIRHAAREFRFRNGGYLWMSIADYSSARLHLQAEAQQLRNPAKDYESQLLEFLHPSGGFGYVLWDPTSRNGRLRAILADRFLLEAEGGDLPPQIAWSRLIDYIPTERLTAVSQHAR